MGALSEKGDLVAKDFRVACLDEERRERGEVGGEGRGDVRMGEVGVVGGTEVETRWRQGAVGVLRSEVVERLRIAKVSALDASENRAWTATNSVVLPRLHGSRLIGPGREQDGST